VFDISKRTRNYYDNIKPEGPGFIGNIGKWMNSVVYSKNAGLFYVSGNIIGYLGEENPIEFFETPNPQIVLRNSELYIYLSNVQGVIKIKGVDKFKNYIKSINTDTFFRKPYRFSMKNLNTFSRYSWPPTSAHFP
jgi:hypothetical protein